MFIKSLDTRAHKVQKISHQKLMVDIEFRAARDVMGMILPQLWNVVLHLWKIVYAPLGFIFTTLE
jgi:hypothetical protein